MQIITLKTKLKFNSDEDRNLLIEALKFERDAFNYCSKEQFGRSKISIVELHAACYKKLRKLYPNSKAQLIIKAENNCISAYRSIRSNKHKIDQPALKKHLATSFDARLFLYKNGELRLTTLEKRVITTPILYPKLEEYLQKYKFGDIVLLSEGRDVFVCFAFKVDTILEKQKLSLGIDLGIRRIATTSDGKLLISKKFNKRKREIRHLKRILQSKSKKSRTAKKHLSKLKNKERNLNKNFNHYLVNRILDTKANAIVIENLNVVKLKSKKHRYQNKNRISQVSFSEIRFMLTYKAALLGKEVVCVSPYYTSQIDHVTGKLEGERKGCRFYSVNGLVYDADVNAAVNIAKRHNLPILCRNVLDGQGLVIDPLR